MALTYVLLPALLAVSFLLKWPRNSVTTSAVGTVTLPFNIKHRMLVMSVLGHLCGIGKQNRRSSETAALGSEFDSDLEAPLASPYALTTNLPKYMHALSLHLAVSL